MLVPSWWETAGGGTTGAPSPMTLSRADVGVLPKKTPKNKPLYSEKTYAEDVRAFSHPGIGLWQIDDSGPIGKPLAAHERINTQDSSKPVAGAIATIFCGKIGTDAKRREVAWSAWFACKGKNLQRCEQTYQNHYNAKTDSIQRVTRDAAVTRLGGMIKRTCVFDNSPPPNGTFPCYYIDPGLAEGFKGWRFKPAGGANGTLPSPLAFPFYSLPDPPFTNEFRLWTAADSGYSGEIFAKRPNGTNSRLSTVWSKLSNIKCNLSSNVLKCESLPSPPQPPQTGDPNGICPLTCYGGDFNQPMIEVREGRMVCNISSYITTCLRSGWNVVGTMKFCTTPCMLLN